MKRVSAAGFGGRGPRAGRQGRGRGGCVILRGFTRRGHGPPCTLPPTQGRPSVPLPQVLSPLAPPQGPWDAERAGVTRPRASGPGVGPMNFRRPEAEVVHPGLKESPRKHPLCAKDSKVSAPLLVSHFAPTSSTVSRHPRDSFQELLASLTQ